jgi:hypothetical protein
MLHKYESLRSYEMDTIYCRNSEYFEEIYVRSRCCDTNLTLPMKGSRSSGGNFINRQCSEINIAVRGANECCET